MSARNTSLVEHAFPYINKSCAEGAGSAQFAILEMKTIFQERVPYHIADTITGDCINWEDTFIALCRFAMSTDCLNDMSAQEKRLWYLFENYEDFMTTSPSKLMCDFQAIGCNLEGNAIVEVDGMPVECDPPVACLPAHETFPRQSLYKSLDTVFMKLLNCEDYNTCGCSIFADNGKLETNDCEKCGDDYQTCS